MLSQIITEWKLCKSINFALEDTKKVREAEQRLKAAISDLQTRGYNMGSKEEIEHNLLISMIIRHG
jgi:hypothetical protein